jgi:predicted XRE-type DNA-binding protein
MAISQEEVMASLSPEMRARVQARARELIAEIEEAMTLRDLRSVQRLTQARVAKLLGVEQDSVSRMERRADMLLSTMSNYVEAMGGKLRLVAEFPNRRPYTVKLGELTEGRGKPRGRRAVRTRAASAKPAAKR